MPNIRLVTASPLTMLITGANEAPVDVDCCCGEAPGLICDSIEAYKYKCGFYGFDSSGRVFKQYDRAVDHWMDCGFAMCDPCAQATTGSYTVTVDENCCWDIIDCDITEQRTCTGGGGDNETFPCDDTIWPYDGHCLEPGDWVQPPPSIGYTSYPCDGCLEIHYVTGSPEYTDTTASVILQGTGCGISGPDEIVHCQQSTIETVSAEYLTSTLISDVEALLPEYSGYFDCDYPEEFTPLSGQGCDCNAVRYLSDDESYYYIMRFIPKFTFAASGSDRTLDYNEHFVPYVGSPSDTPKSIFVASGLTEIIGDEVVEPSTDGVITITDMVLA